MIGFSVRRPVTVAMAYLAVALLGVASWMNVPLELLPDTTLPRLTVRADWLGASPEVTEAFLTAPLEAAVQQVRGVERIVSTSSDRWGAGMAEVEVEFARGTDMEFARLDLSERLSALEEELPPDAGRPVVEEYVPDEFREQDRPFLVYTITGPYTPEALRAHLDDVVAPELRQVDGVAEVVMFGGRERMLEVELDERRALALGLDPFEVQRRIDELEYDAEAGYVVEGGVHRAVAIRERAESPEDVRRLPLLTDRGRTVRVEDVARVRDGWEDPRNHYRIDGQPAVSFTVLREIGTNAVRVADAVKARMGEVETVNPPGVRVILDQDESEAIRTQLTDLRVRALTAAGVIFVVLLLFLRSFRSSLVVFATIGFSVLITLNLIYFTGQTLNVLTLMGLAMGFGLVVDNSVVVLENVHRRARTGEPALDAAEHGTREMVLPVVVATLTTVIVFLPFVYLQGELRLYYLPLALVVGFTNLASLFVTFTFTPALAGRILGVLGRTAGGPPREPLYVRAYRAMIGGSLRFPWLVVVLALGMLGGSWWLFDEYVTRGTVWRNWWNEQSYIDIRVRLPRGEELTRTDDLVRHFEERLRRLPEVERFVTRVQPQYGSIRVTFPDSLENTVVPLSIKEQMEAYSHGFGGAEVHVYGYGPSFYGGGASPPNYAITVLGYSYETVQEIAEGLGRVLQGYSRIRDVDTNSSGTWYQRDKATEVVLRLDRRALAMHGLSARDVVGRVQAAVGAAQGRGSVMRVGDEEVRLAVRFAGHETRDLHDMRQLLIPAPGGGAVRLEDVAEVGEREVLSRILREDQQYRRIVSYEFRGPAKLGDRVRDGVLENTAVPAGYTLVGRDEYTWSDEERTQIYGVLAVSLILIFMVTAALFESLRQPLCVLLTVPMALIGVFLVFFFVGASFTREAIIGVIMMGGVVVNNAVLLIDRVNRLRRVDGVPLEPAIVRGTLERVRPILMTSATTIFGLLPLVLFSEAADSNIWNALAYSLLGGLMSSTFLVLTVTPALYLLFERRLERKRLAREGVMAPEPDPV